MTPDQALDEYHRIFRKSKDAMMSVTTALYERAKKADLWEHAYCIEAAGAARALHRQTMADAWARYEASKR